jgi:hypothetical protein
MNEGAKGDIPPQVRAIQEPTYRPGHLSHFFESYKDIKRLTSANKKIRRVI